MNRRLRRLRVVTAALLSALLLAGGSFASTVYRCRYDRVARRSCCCPAGSEAPTPPASADALRATRCCEAQILDSAAAPADARRLDSAPALAVAVLLPALPPALAPRSLVAEPVGVRAATGPPLFVLTHAFLL
ncbi:MAG: hypothetical protein AABZ30_03490 [Myxococcota bacterium]